MALEPNIQTPGMKMIRRPAEVVKVESDDGWLSLVQQGGIETACPSSLNVAMRHDS